jgi:hypothetical protein
MMHHSPTLSPAALHRMAAEAARARYVLRFQSLFHSGRALAFPCDAKGAVQWETMSERARTSFRRAQECVGIEFATPAVEISDLH